MFEIKDLRFKDILHIEDLVIEEGEITCIVGKSGGGKTTFLKLLNNMISWDSGMIKYKNKDIREYNPVELRREVLMLPQNPVAFPGTIEDNFVLTQKYAEKNAKNKEDFKKLLKTVGMKEHSLSEEAENLSGGEKQRVALVRVMLLEPDILLLDEPSSALDEETEEFIIKMVVDYIKKRNGTLIMVTHSTRIAEEYGEKIVTINNGEVESVN